MSVSISLTGIEEIDQVLRGLPKQVTHQILTAGHADAAKPLITAAQIKVRKKTGDLAASIGVKKTNLKKTGAIGLVQIGPLRGGNKNGYHGHLIEFGHKIVTRSGRQVGYSSKFPFMEPSFNATKGLIEQGIKVFIAKRLIAYMKRIIKKYA